MKKPLQILFYLFALSIRSGLFRAAYHCMNLPPKELRQMNYNTQRKRREGVPNTTVNLIIETANDIGIDLKPAMQSAGLAYSSARRNSAAGVSPAQFAPIYRAYMVALHKRCTSTYPSDPNCNDESMKSTVEEADLFLSCIINSDDLYGVITKSIRFSKALQGRGWDLDLSCRDGEAIFSINTRYSGSLHAQLINIFAVWGLYKLFSWLVDETLPLSNINIVDEQFVDRTMLAEMLCCPVRFNGKSNSIAFPEKILRRPVIRTYRELVRALETSPVEFLALNHAPPLSEQVEGIFRKALLEHNEIPNVDRVAYILGQSGPTLRRRLAQENSSFQNLVDKCRMDMAAQLLNQPNLTLDEIASILGFSASSVFSRAFKSWTGVAPSFYRQSMGTGLIDISRIAS